MGHGELHALAEPSPAWHLQAPLEADELFSALVPDSGLGYRLRKRNLFADIKMLPLT